ncbi:MAG: hypothetical protein IPP86_04140 [Bacteroidetes bacterium]|nr:hypothetical protein [Bacteroidota bacterium]
MELLKITLSATLVISFLSIFSCRKEGCEAGTGGEVTLKIMPEHHGVPIYNSQNYRDTVYVKFNATDFPGPDRSNFDLIMWGNANENFVKVSGLKCGQYYIMVSGFDTSAQWNIRVVGGIPLNFSESSGEKLVTVPVTE